MIAIMLAATSALAASKPTVPAAPPTKGLAVALLTTGIDYRRADVARNLARDGEGELIGWDALDGDRRPFGDDPLTSDLVALAPTFVIPVRVDWDNGAAIRDGIEFVRRSPSRVIVVPPSYADGKGADALVEAIRRAPDLLFIIAAGDDGVDIDAAPRLPAALPFDNAIVVTTLAVTAAHRPNRGAKSIDLALVPPSATREAPGRAGDPPRTSGEAAIMLAAHFTCASRQLARAGSAADVKRELIALARKDRSAPIPLLESCASRR